MTLNTACQPLLACKVPFENSIINKYIKKKKKKSSLEDLLTDFGERRRVRGRWEGWGEREKMNENVRNFDPLPPICVLTWD